MEHGVRAPTVRSSSVAGCALSSEFYFAFWARSSRSPRRSLVWWPEWSRFFWSRSTVRSERQRLSLCRTLSRARVSVETLRDKSQRAAERVCVACCIVHSRMRPHDLLSHVLCYLKRNLPDLGDRAGRGHIVLRLKGLGRTELPVWARLLHGCLRGVDILWHGRARRSVGRRGAATGWRARNMAHLEAGGLLECA